MTRAFIYGLLQADANSNSAGSLKTLGVKPEAIAAAEAADDMTLFPFITIRWGNVARGVGASHRRYVDVWAHDRNRDYDRIDDILTRVAKLFSAIEARATEKGSITQIDWQGESPDLRDDGYDTVTRNSTFLVIESTG